MTVALGSLLAAHQHRTIVSVIRSHPEWTIGQLAQLLDTSHGRDLGRVKVGDLQLGDRQFPDVDLARLQQAQRSRGPAFDACVLEVIREAPGAEVRASYLRARVGGPRWKLLDALGRLAAAGQVERRGTTSATRYRAVQARDN